LITVVKFTVEKILNTYFVSAKSHSKQL